MPPTPERRHSTRKKQKAIGVDSSSEEWQSEEDQGETAGEDSIYEDDDEYDGDGDEDTRTIVVKKFVVKATKRSTQTFKRAEVSFMNLVS